VVKGIGDSIVRGTKKMLEQLFSPVVTSRKKQDPLWEKTEREIIEGDYTALDREQDLNNPIKCPKCGSVNLKRKPSFVGYILCRDCNCAFREGKRP
jgi:hypothetical protein